MESHTKDIIRKLKEAGFEVVRRTKHGDLLKKEDRTVLVSQNVKSKRKASYIIRKALG